MRHIEVMTARDIKRDYRVDPVEFQQHMNLAHNNVVEVEVMEDLVYRRKLRESHRNFRDSLYDSIKENWITTPIELSYSDKLIHDGLHRLACALHINDDKLIAVKFNDLF